MKKLVLACCTVMVIGGCMALGGWAAGGQLYGSYYDGALHPVIETIRDASDYLGGRLHYRSWWENGVWRSGWFSGDGFSDRIEDAVDDTVDAALDEFDTDWVEDWLETRQKAIHSADTDLPKASLDAIRTLELTLKSGTGSGFTIDSGADYGLEGDYSIVSNEWRNGKWELELACNGDPVTLILPENTSYDSIEITARLDAAVDIAVPLRASEIELYTESGSVDAELLSARELNLSVSDGLLYAYLDGSPQSYRIDAKTNYGPAFLNGAELIGPNTGVSRYDNRKTVSNPLSELEIHVNGGGTAELYTAE